MIKEQESIQMLEKLYESAKIMGLSFIELVKYGKTNMTKEEYEEIGDIFESVELFLEKAKKQKEEDEQKQKNKNRNESIEEVNQTNLDLDQEEKEKHEEEMNGKEEELMVENKVEQKEKEMESNYHEINTEGDEKIENVHQGKESESVISSDEETWTVDDLIEWEEQCGSKEEYEYIGEVKPRVFVKWGEGDHYDDHELDIDIENFKSGLICYEDQYYQLIAEEQDAEGYYLYAKYKTI